MNKYQTYFGQIITDDELNEIFDSFATAIEQFVADFNYSGIAVGGEVTQNAVPNMGVLINGPTVVYDQYANRISFGAPVPLNLSLDENNQSTAIVGSANEKYLSIFVKFLRTQTDPREDELGNTVYFKHVAGYQFKVVQGSEAPVGTAARPALRGDQILLADVRLIANQTTVLNADISSTRSQVIFDLPGTPLAIREKSLKPSLQAMVNAINAITSDTIIVPAIPGTPTSLPQGSVHAVFVAFLAAFNALANQVGGMPQNMNDVAFLSTVQEFTGAKTFNGLDLKDQAHFTTTDPQRPLIGCGVVPGAARWKKILEFKHGTTSAGGQYVRMYTGSDGTTAGNGALAITTNCDWNGTVWQQRDPALSSLALIWTYNRLRVSHKYAAAPDWTDWDSTLPGAINPDNNGVHMTSNLVVNEAGYFGGNLESNDLHARGNFDVDGSSDLQAVKISGEVTTGDGTLHMPTANLDCINITCNDITADDFTGDKVNGSDFLYIPTAKFRNFEIPLAYAQPQINRANYTACWAFIGGVWQAIWWAFDNQPTPGVTPPGANPCILDIPLPLPHGAVLKKIEILHYLPTTDGNDFRLYRLKSSWGSNAAPPGNPSTDVANDDWWGPNTPLPSSAGWHTSTMEDSFAGGITINKATTQYVLRCFAGKTGVPVTGFGSLSGSSPGMVARVRCTWDDPGPRNY